MLLLGCILSCRQEENDIMFDIKRSPKGLLGSIQVGNSHLVTKPKQGTAIKYKVGGGELMTLYTEILTTTQNDLKKGVTQHLVIVL